MACRSSTRKMNAHLSEFMKQTIYLFKGELSEQERALFSLPLRFGGMQMGLCNPAETSDSEFLAIIAITRKLTDIISHCNKQLT